MFQFPETAWQFWWNNPSDSTDGKFFGGELLIRILPTTCHQIFLKFIFNSKVSVKNTKIQMTIFRVTVKGLINLTYNLIVVLIERGGTSERWSFEQVSLCWWTSSLNPSTLTVVKSNLTILMKSCNQKHSWERNWRRTVNQKTTKNSPSNIL